MIIRKKKNKKALAAETGLARAAWWSQGRQRQRPPGMEKRKRACTHPAHMLQNQPEADPIPPVVVTSKKQRSRPASVFGRRGNLSADGR